MLKSEAGAICARRRPRNCFLFFNSFVMQAIKKLGEFFGNGKGFKLLGS